MGNDKTGNSDCIYRINSITIDENANYKISQLLEAGIFDTRSESVEFLIGKL